MTLTIQLPVSSPYQLNKILQRQNGKNGFGLTASTTAGSNASASSRRRTPAPPRPPHSSERAETNWAWETWGADPPAVRVQHAPPDRARSRQPAAGTEHSGPLDGRASQHAVGAKRLVPGQCERLPVLSKASQSFFRTMFKKNPTVVLSGVQSPPPTHSRGGPLAYLQYLRHLEKAAPRMEPSTRLRVATPTGFRHRSSADGQSRGDNVRVCLKRDPVKYALYEEAVYKALLDRPASASTLIWVCGAGRGPLVDRCLNAADRAGRSVKLVALEKNPNALVTLQERQALEWAIRACPVWRHCADTLCRPAWQTGPDIVVSELLGSLGDNALSPECLDGAMRSSSPMACPFLRRTRRSCRRSRRPSCSHPRC